jgi:hypothetical protein
MSCETIDDAMASLLIEATGPEPGVQWGQGCFWAPVAPVGSALQSWRPSFRATPERSVSPDHPSSMASFRRTGSKYDGRSPTPPTKVMRPALVLPRLPIRVPRPRIEMRNPGRVALVEGVSGLRREVVEVPEPQRTVCLFCSSNI